MKYLDFLVSCQYQKEYNDKKSWEELRECRRNLVQEYVPNEMERNHIIKELDQSDMSLPAIAAAKNLQVKSQTIAYILKKQDERSSRETGNRGQLSDKRG